MFALDSPNSCFSKLRPSLLALFAIVVLISLPGMSQGQDSLADALKAINTVQTNGVGHESAAKAMKVLNQASINEIPKILEAMDDSNSISENWFRSAINSIVRKEGELPRDAIQAYYNETSHSAMGRLMAFELLTDGNEELAKKMIAGLADDPSLPLRFKAIKAMVEQADAAKELDVAQAIGKLGVALNKARDINQVLSIAKKLDELGVKVNLQKQMGFLNTWHIVGSFDNKDMAGFDVAYGPENSLDKIDLTATYKDQDGNEASWEEVTTSESTGNIDLNKLVGKVKGATVYALGTFKAEEDIDADIRIGSANATKIWLNGKLVMENEIYHNSNSIDKFIGKAKLKKGDNEILIKVCQNEQTQPWAQDWQFQLRICDATGKAIAPAKPPARNY